MVSGRVKSRLPRSEEWNDPAPKDRLLLSSSTQRVLVKTKFSPISPAQNNEQREVSETYV